MNPARSFGPALVRGDFAHFSVYPVGPLAGPIAAVGTAWILRGPSGDSSAEAAAQGALEPHALPAAESPDKPGGGAPPPTK